MRHSGETTPVEGEDEEAPREDDGTADSHGEPSVDRPSRLYPIWLKIEPPKRRFASAPANLSRQTWTRLSRQIAAFLRSRLNAALLREAVHLAAAELRLSGASSDDIAAALRRAVLEHPELGTLDRMNVVTRRLASEELLDRVLKWASEPGMPGLE